MRELDILLERYLRLHYPDSTDDDKETFCELLTLADPELAAYLLQGEPHPDPAVAYVVARILSQA